MQQVCTKEEQEILTQDSLKSTQLRNKLLKNKDVQGLETALHHRNQLLLFDDTCSQRTKIIDDEADYFSPGFNPWLTDKQRKELQSKAASNYARRHASVREQTFTLDLAGRRIVKDLPKSSSEQEDSVDISGTETEVSSTSSTQKTHLNKRVLELVWVDPNIPLSYGVTDTKAQSFELSRIQDRELLEMVDEGKCLSVHQPYASFIIWGIKKHEGRSWYTPHRGCLWIASTGKVPSLSLVEEASRFYAMQSDLDIPSSPEKYSVGCLLGCISLVECIPQEEYRERYPEGECDDLYVWILEESQELPIKFPVKGQKQICKYACD